jgi:hypothetical protein
LTPGVVITYAVPERKRISGAHNPDFVRIDLFVEIFIIAKALRIGSYVLAFAVQVFDQYCGLVDPPNFLIVLRVETFGDRLMQKRFVYDERRTRQPFDQKERHREDREVDGRE